MSSPCVRYLTLPALWLLPLLARAQETSPVPITERSSGNGDTLGSLATLGIGLLVVLGLIFACAWLVRRMNGLTGMNTGAMKVVSVMALGTRERIALIDVAGTQILVGVTPTSIRTLHVFDEPVVSGDREVNSDFAKKLRTMMGRSWPSGGAGKRGDQD